MNTTTLFICIFVAIAAAAVAHFYTVRWSRLIVRRALRREKRAHSDREQVINFLNRFADNIVTSTNNAEWMSQVAAYLYEVVNAQSIRIYALRDETLKLVATSGDLPKASDNKPGLEKSNSILKELNRRRIELGNGVIGTAARTGKSALHTDFGTEPNRRMAESVHSFMAVPLLLNDQVEGVICAVNRRRRSRKLARADLFLLESLSHQIAIGGRFIRAYDDLSQQERIHQELVLAQRIQNSLLPERAPTSDWFKIHACNHAAREVSGDYYDFFEISDDLLLVLIADASGKGVPACMLMAICRSLVRSNAVRFKDNLEGLFKKINQSLFDDTDAAQFITMACCLIDKRDQTVEYARAGHTELLIRLPSGNVQIMEPDGPALGIISSEFGVEFDTFSFSWLPGTTLLMYTDGITEARNAEGEEFGLERLVNVWHEQDLDPESTANGILDAVNAFACEIDPEDDQTMVIMTRNMDGD
jgi:sigma-B regulation protein RsbU (phosphoserine phosphatase)